jgi:hypothetical protein
MGNAKKLNEQDKSAIYGMNLFSDLVNAEIPKGLKAGNTATATRERRFLAAAREWYSRIFLQTQIAVRF